MRHEVCAFGFEPNPNHNVRLESMEARLSEKAFGVVIFTETAVGTKNGNITFYIDDMKGKSAGLNNNAWGSSTIKWAGDRMQTNVTASLLDFVSFLAFEVNQRKGMDNTSRVFAKMDIEGAEYELFTALIDRKAICGIDAIYAEFHKYFVKGGLGPKVYIPRLHSQIKKIENCNTLVFSLDDESYGK